MLPSLLCCFAVTSQFQSPIDIKVLESDFDRVAGIDWKGSLTYLDYSSKKPVEIKSALYVKSALNQPSSWMWNVGYTDEPDHNSGGLLSLRFKGQFINDEKVIDRVVLGSGDVKITTEYKGDDDGKPALNRHVYILGGKEISLQKLVKFQSDMSFFERHIYRWKRS